MALLKKKLAFAFAISLMLVACGDDDSGSGVNKSVEKISDADIEEATYDDLPACKSTNKDKSAYVVDEALTYVCDGKKWVSEEKIDSKSSSKEKSSSSVEEKISSSSVEQKRLIQSSSSEEESSCSSEEEVSSSGIIIGDACIVGSIEDTIYKDTIYTRISMGYTNSIWFQRRFRRKPRNMTKEYCNCEQKDNCRCDYIYQDCLLTATVYTSTTDTIVVSDVVSIEDSQDQFWNCCHGEALIGADLSVDTLSIIKITGSCRYQVERYSVGINSTEYIMSTFEYTNFNCKIHSDCGRAYVCKHVVNTKT